MLTLKDYDYDCESTKFKTKFTTKLGDNAINEKHTCKSRKPR